jgi:hypothetical protein
MMSGSKVLESKTMKVIPDPDVKFAAGEADRYNAIVDTLHSLQRRGVAAAGALNTLYSQVQDASKKVADNSSIPAAVKAQFESLNKDLDAVRKKFGVPLNATPAGGRGGGRGGAPLDPENVLGRTSALKNSVAAIWEAPSATLVRQYNELKIALPKAVTDANAVLTKAGTVSAALKKYDITLTVPAAVK